MRLLIQLVDAKTEAEARDEIRGMYGEECLAVAVFHAGTERSKHLARGTWNHSTTGYSVYVPDGFRLPNVRSCGRVFS